MALRYQKGTAKASLGDLLLVVHDFEARSSDELSLSKGDRIELIERDDDFGDGWYLGRHTVTGHIGLFPEVYTTTVPQTSSLSNVSASSYEVTPGTQSSISSPIQASFVKIEELAPPVQALHADETPQAAEGPGTPLYLDRFASAPPPLGALPPIPAGAPKVGSNISITAPQPTTPNVTKGIGLSKLSRHLSGEESPVMNQTLSVINEHITDLNTPRQSFSAAEKQGLNDSGSEYSSQMEHRVSYITGDETDEEEQDGLTEAEVCTWTSLQVAEHLGERGVRAYHCKWFAEQEITGDILLGMDLASLLTKEFDLGVSGHRLHTWQIIQGLQQEVRNGKTPRERRPSHHANNASLDTPPSSRTSVAGTVLPRIPSLVEGPSTAQKARLQEQQNRPIPPSKPDAHSRQSSYISGPGQGGPRRPSAASVREFNHSRRHSSVDVAAPPLPAPPNSTPYSPGPPTTPATPHKKQASFDRNWTMGAATSKLNGGPGSPSGTRSALSSPERPRAEESSRTSVSITPTDLDRGYFSGGEVENRRTRNVLRKRESGGHPHSRNSSYADEQKSRTTGSSFRHSRFGSADSVRTPFSSQSTGPKPLSPAAQAYYGIGSKDRFRKSNMNNTASPIPPPKDYPSPTVTKLDSGPGGNGVTPPLLHSGSPEALRHQWDAALKSRAPGSRAFSDAVTGIEKTIVGSSTNAIPSPKKESPVQSPTLTSSSTPSGSKSVELDSPDASRSSMGTNNTASTNGNMRRKSKKDTSAYTKGLEKKTPQEQMIGCDYSGWMKKKSTNLMTIWKSRLFVLRGRRLSYYYSENDEQERGLIDISSHRVLPADNDRITGLHATLTGATHSPTSPQNAQTPTMASEEAAAQSSLNSVGTSSDSMFIFKLVPPRTGLSRAVNFTKPTIHYFAVDNVQQGRLWMAALMKATIGRDESKPITTTYLHKTISLARARRMRYRPPGLMSSAHQAEDNDDESVQSPTAPEKGLNIQGLANVDENQPSDGGDRGDGDGVEKTDIGVATSAQAHTHDGTEASKAEK